MISSYYKFFHNSDPSLSNDGILLLSEGLCGTGNHSSLAIRVERKLPFDDGHNNNKTVSLDYHVLYDNTDRQNESLVQKIQGPNWTVAFVNDLSTRP